MNSSNVRGAAFALSCFLVMSSAVLAAADGGAGADEQVILRCGTPEMDPALAQLLTAGDCAYASTNPLASYNPGPTYDIPVVVHVIQSTSGLGSAVTDARVQTQIDVLN